MDLDPARNICPWLRTEHIVVTVNEQVGPEVGQLAPGGPRRREPHREYGELDRERDDLTVHAGVTVTRARIILGYIR